MSSSSQLALGGSYPGFNIGIFSAENGPEVTVGLVLGFKYAKFPPVNGLLVCGLSAAMFAPPLNGPITVSPTKLSELGS